jgi:spore coat polysaccharide biosynthesis protein SpsF
MKTGIILQIRLDSARLPRKALLKLAGEPLSVHVMRSLKRVHADTYILATTEDSRAELGPLARACGFEFFAGPKQDVLARYCQAIRAYGVERVVRATGDNPLVSADLAKLLLDRRATVPADYSGYLGMPSGMGVEVVEAEALFKAEAESLDPFEHEHVCPYLYRHPELFKIDRPDAPSEYLLGEGFAVTVDTQADFEAMEALFEKLYRGKPLEDRAVLDYLKDARKK